MFGFTLFLWSPMSFISSLAPGAILAWIIAIDFKSPEPGAYLFKLRVLGLEVGVIYRNSTVLSSQLQVMPEEDEKKTGNIPRYADWVRYLSKNNVKVLVSDKKLIDYKAKTFILPTEIQGTVLEIGHKIALGHMDSYEIVWVTGFQVGVDGKTTYFYSQRSGEKP